MSSEHQPTIAPTATDPQTVLVTGATGKVGRHLTRYLLAAGHRVRALTRYPLIAGLPEGVELHTGDPTRGDTVAAAADGADAALLVWMGFDATGAEDTAAALARNVGHIVYLSAAELQDGRRGAKPGVWADVEAAVRDSGATWTFLRAGGFAANTLGWARVIRAGESVGMRCGTGPRWRAHRNEPPTTSRGSPATWPGHSPSGRLTTLTTSGPSMPPRWRTATPTNEGVEQLVAP